jgi:hypothetical protein
MGKRFRDTELWGKEWYVALSCVERCAIDYVLCRCDPVGVWAPAFSVAERLIGESLDWLSFTKRVNGNIVILDDGKWWLRDFCVYQYGRINPESESKVQRSLYALLVKHGLWDAYLLTLKPTVRPTVEPTVQDKEKEKVKVKEKEKESYAEGVSMTKAEYSALVDQYGERVIKLAIDKVAAQQIKTGKPYKSPRGAILQWGIRAALEEIKRGGTPAKDEYPLCPDCRKPTTSRRSGEGGGRYLYTCPCGGSVVA